MSPSESRNGRAADSAPEGGVLAALPRARPQRASARRAAARTGAKAAAPKTAATSRKTATTKKAAAPKTAATSRKTTATKKVAAPTRAAPAKRRAAQTSSPPPEPPAPKQGYEPEEELELGKAVNPPSGVELVESVADILGELANSGLTAGGRLLRDAFSLLRRP
jgi:hypothetical protein